MTPTPKKARTSLDVIIAKHCILHGLALLHANRDFDVMEKHLGLRVHRPF
jgi:predicted nucleic acid-binding protein